MLPEVQEGWFVRNVRDATWVKTEEFGSACLFEDPNNRFPELGINIRVLQPGKPNCRYHRESAQENFLVLSGECKLLINGEERALKAWDFVHCPAGVSHVFIGAGDGPCAVLMIGARPKEMKLWYPELAEARAYGAESKEPTADPAVAYADIGPRTPVENPNWPLEQR